MILREFGEDKSGTFQQMSLADCNGFLGELIEIESEKPMASGGRLALRMELVEEARQLLEIAENADAKIMRVVLARIQHK